MLDFFRRNQRIFFIIFTVVIVISFSFFGTYSTISERVYEDPVVFTTSTGQSVKRSEIEELSLFLSSDQYDKIAFYGMQGPNFLNDGVVTNDFIQTGLGLVLLEHFAKDIQQELEPKFQSEKKFVPYTHPDAQFLSASNAWNHFAPAMNTNLALLKNARSPMSPEAMNARIQLYLNEKQVPANALRQILKFQQKQFPWVSPDPNLDRTDLSLFGYHTVEDWFGMRFLRLVSEFIIDSATLAEKHGYSVSDAEALSDLENNADLSFQQNKNSPYINVANSADYFREQLRIMRLDQTKAIKIWKKVLLFRRLFQDAGNIALVDPEMYQEFFNFAEATAVGDIYRLPEEDRLKNFHALQLLETYIGAVSKKTPESGDVLALPTAYKSPEEVTKLSPGLVQKDYIVEIGSINKGMLQSKVSIKETWDWETEESHFELLQKKFPSVGILQGKTVDERFKALASLDDKTRAQVDAFARESIVDAHPEWLDAALKNVNLKKTTLGIRKKGGSLPIFGFDGKRGELMNALDTKDSYDRLTGDNQHFYVIKVLERDPTDRVISFKEAIKDNTLDALLDERLEPLYISMRESDDATQFKKANGEWKSYLDVKEIVAEKYFAKTLDALRESTLTESEKKEMKPEAITPDFLATRRFFPYFKETLAKIKKDLSSSSQYTQDHDLISQHISLSDQWKLVKSDFKMQRSSPNEHGINKDALFHMKIGEWSPINTPPNGDISTLQIRSFSENEDPKVLTQKMLEGQKLLSMDIQSTLAKQLLLEWKLNIDFMKKN